MSDRQPSDGGNLGIPARQEPEQIAVLLTQEQAYCASVALVDEVRKQISYLTGDEYRPGDIDEAHVGGMSSVDAQSTCRSLSRALCALEAVGWPHAHMRPEYMHNLTEREASGVGPWAGRECGRES
jgi:hypothetical protein